MSGASGITSNSKRCFNRSILGSSILDGARFLEVQHAPETSLGEVHSARATAVAEASESGSALQPLRDHDVMHADRELKTERAKGLQGPSARLRPI